MTATDELVLAPVEDRLTDEDAHALFLLQQQAADELDADMAAEATGPKLDADPEPEFTGLGLMSVPNLNGIDMKALRAQVIKRAASQVGTKEKPRYSNIIWAWDDCKPAWHGQPWCAAAVTSWWGRAGVDLRKALENPYYCPYLEREAKKYGAWHAYGSGYTPKLGDPILFGRGLATHVGISYPGEGNWSGYRTIEGNTSASNAGSQTNGDGCYLRYRSGSFIRGWIDMDVFVAAMVKAGELKVTAPKLVKAAATTKTKPDFYWSAYQRTGFSGNRKMVQGWLKTQGFYKGTPNGLDDATHRAAVKGYQLAIGDTGSDADGIFGPKQLRRIVDWGGFNLREDR